MSVRLEAAATMEATVERVWEVLVDWPGQGRWIPLTSVQATTEQDQGLGVRVVALSGFWVGTIPIGLLDKFVVTGWTPPTDGQVAELEILHLGPYFTGEGVFRLTPGGTPTSPTTTVRCVEMINLPGGGVLDPLVRAQLPLMRWGFGRSLRSLARVAESRVAQSG